MKNVHVEEISKLPDALDQKSPQLKRRNSEVLNIREHFSTSPHIVIQNRL